MKIAVIGANGRTGRAVAECAVERGYEVTAVVRRPETMTTAGESMRVVRGNVSDADSLVQALQGCTAVISTIGIGSSREETEVYSRGVANLLKAMATCEVGRIAVVSAAPVGPRQDHPGLERRVVIPLLWRFFGATYRDMQRMEKVLADSDAAWVALRPPRLLDKPALGDYRIAPRPPAKGRSLRYPDLAAALLDALNRPELFGTAQYVAN